MTENKSYNPFKMWGSWVGFVIGALPFIIDVLKIRGAARIFNYLALLNPIYYLERSFCHDVGCGVLTAITLPIIFFLIGWGVHSLARNHSTRKIIYIILTLAILISGYYGYLWWEKQKVVDINNEVDSWQTYQSTNNIGSKFGIKYPEEYKLEGPIETETGGYDFAIYPNKYALDAENHPCDGYSDCCLRVGLVNTGKRYKTLDEWIEKLIYVHKIITEEKEIKIGENSFYTIRYDDKALPPSTRFYFLTKNGDNNPLIYQFAYHFRSKEQEDRCQIIIEKILSTFKFTN